MRLKMAGALIPVLLRAITPQRCRIVVRDILGQYQYYCMFCLVTHIVCSNLKSKNQKVSGFSDQWVLNAMVDLMKFNINAYQHFYLTHPNFQDIWKSQSSKIFPFKKKCHYFCTGVYIKLSPPPKQTNKQTNKKTHWVSKYRFHLLFQVTVMALSYCSTKWSNRLASVLTLSKVAAMCIIVLTGFVQLGKGTRNSI